MLFEGGNYLPPYKYDSVQIYVEKAHMYTSHFEQGWKVPKIHALDPTVIALLYRDARAVYTGSTEYPMFVDKGWLLKDPNGELISSKIWTAQRIVDVGNTAYQQWVAVWIKGWVEKYGYDGVLLDDLLPSNEILYGCSSTTAINPRTNKPWTDEEWKNAIVALTNKVKDTIGNKLVLGNGIFDGERFFGLKNRYYVDLLKSKIDGIMSEGLIMGRQEKQWYSEDKWKKSIDFVVWLENNFLNKDENNFFSPVAQNVDPYDKKGISLPVGATKEQYALYAFASLLLGASSSKHYLNFGYYVDDFSQSLFKIELGSPLGAYYIIQGTHVYSRDFSKVKVLVNPTDQSYSVNLGEGYETLDGTLVTSPITLDPHVGMILIRS